MAVWGWSERDIPDLAGRVAVVTGANRGLGREVTRYLAGGGARVIMACRDEASGEAAAAALRAQHPTATLEVRALDLASLASVQKFVDDLAAGEPRLDVLGNNAGLMAVDRGLTADGFELHMGVNHLAHFALTLRLLPLLRETPGSRVVTMSSMVARLGSMNLDDLLWERRPYDRWQAYFQSKLANLLFTFELDRRLRVSGAPAVLAAHPGGSRTGLGHKGGHWTNRMLPAWNWFCRSAALGALPFVRAATDPAAQAGEYFGPQFQVWGPPVRERPSRQSRDPGLAAALWERSEALTGARL